jgi:hypothetical protein
MGQLALPAGADQGELATLVAGGIVLDAVE